MAKIIGAAIIAGGGGSEYPRLKGTWVFNSTLTSMNWSGTALNGVIHYLCNGVEYNDISWDADAFIYGNSFEAYNRETDRWNNEAYRVITFTEPFERWYHAPFYDWFVSNAVRGGVAYKLNSDITCSTTRRLSGMNSNYGRSYIDDCTPRLTEMPNGSKILLHDGNLADLTGITVEGEQSIEEKTLSSKTYIRSSLTMWMHYVKKAPDSLGLTCTINGTQTVYGSQKMKGAGSVTCPSSMTYTTNNEILLFSAVPTGNLLTWLNTNATKI